MTSVPRPGRLSGFLLLVFFVGILPLTLSAQERFALVIGNGDYKSVTKLKNPVNDATDMAEALKSLGFKVTLLKDASLDDMENAVVQLGTNLGQSPGAYGFFFYAGHGVQANGVNFLIPTDADIKSEAFLKNRALGAQEVLDTLQQAGNALNVVVLDACRDNPFGWARSAGRGLSVIGSQPPGSIIAYATSAGSTAQDGEGRNGLFTSKLLKNLRTPGLEIKEVFNRTGADVMTASGNKQIPAVYTQFFKSAFLAGSLEVPQAPPAAAEDQGPSFGSESFLPGGLSISVLTDGTLDFLGKKVVLSAGGVLPINNLKPGNYTLVLEYADGQKETKTISVQAGKTLKVPFTYEKASPVPENEPNFGAVSVTTGSLSISVATAGTLEILGKKVSIPAGGSLPVNKLNPGDYPLTITYADGQTETKTVKVVPGQEVAVSFRYGAAPAQTDKAPVKKSYAVGDIGPAGGWILSAVNGTYLETTPQDVGKMSRSDGLDAGSRFSVLGYTGWRLPTLQELDMMYKELKKKDLGNFADGRYWSSTIGTTGRDGQVTSGFSENLGTGVQTNDTRLSNLYFIRLVRGFTVP